MTKSLRLGRGANRSWGAAAARSVSLLGLLCLPLAWSPPALAQDAASNYPNMAPIAQYRYSDRAAEIAAARSAAPRPIADKATVLTLGKTGYETAVQGSNGFVCFVERSWANDFDQPHEIVAAPGSMAYMLSKEQLISDPTPPAPVHWYPHVMFFVPATDGSPWGANVPGAPLSSATSTLEPVTTYFLVVPKWSDGTLGPYTPESSKGGEHHHG